MRSKAMAYIDREKAQKYLLTYQNDGHSYEPSYFASALENLPAADVIERCKINKAIEELQNMKVYDRTRTARLVSLPEVFEILKKNSSCSKNSNNICFFAHLFVSLSPER